MAMNDTPNRWARNGMNGVTSMVMVVLRAISVALALFLLALSVPLFFLPIPLGLPLRRALRRQGGRQRAHSDIGCALEQRCTVAPKERWSSESERTVAPKSR